MLHEAIAEKVRCIVSFSQQLIRSLGAHCDVLPTRRYLQRRLLIGEDDSLLIPVFQRWLLEFQLDAAG